MIIKFSDCLTIDDGIDISKSLLTSPTLPLDNHSFDITQIPQVNVWLPPLDIDKKIFLQGVEYKIVSLSKFVRHKGRDGKYHGIYIWIDYDSGEYYIGKVNREKWTQIKNYTGSGVKFRSKYKKHSDRYVRYYLFVCDSNKETEEIEAKLVNEELLKDPFCLNIIKGGGGISNVPYSDDRKDKQRQYMKDHPERYEAMLQAVHNFDEEKIRQRNLKIKETMSSEHHKEMSRERMLRFKNERPEDYKAAREKNKIVLNNPEIKAKRVKAINKYKEENPEKARIWEENRKKAANSPEAKKKRGNSQKEWIKNNPEKAAERKAKAKKTYADKYSNAVNMVDLKTGQIIKTFCSIKEAANWLLDNNCTSSVNPSSQIAAVCKKKQIPGHGIKKTAYGFDWEYVDHKK